MKDAQGYLDKVADGNSQDPYLYDAMIQMGRYASFSEEQTQTYFNKALALVPNMRMAIWDMALFYSPMWEGSAEKMMKFVKQYGATAPKGSYERLLIVEYYQQVGFAAHHNGSYFAPRAEWKFIKKEFEDYLSVHPDDRYVHSWYSSWAYEGGHYEEAKQEFDILGNKNDANSFWTDVAFENAKKIVNSMLQKDPPHWLVPPDIPASK